MDYDIFWPVAMLLLIWSWIKKAPRRSRENASVAGQATTSLSTDSQSQISKSLQPVIYNILQFLKDLLDIWDVFGATGYVLFTFDCTVQTLMERLLVRHALDSSTPKKKKERIRQIRNMIHKHAHTLADGSIENSPKENAEKRLRCYDSLFVDHSIPLHSESEDLIRTAFNEAKGRELVGPVPDTLKGMMESLNDSAVGDAVQRMLLEDALHQARISANILLKQLRARRISIFWTDNATEINIEKVHAEAKDHMHDMLLIRNDTLHWIFKWKNSELRDTYMDYVKTMQKQLGLCFSGEEIEKLHKFSRTAGNENSKGFIRECVRLIEGIPEKDEKLRNLHAQLKEVEALNSIIDDKDAEIDELNDKMDEVKEYVKTLVLCPKSEEHNTRVLQNIGILRGSKSDDIPLDNIEVKTTKNNSA
ncbi:uncharacterized protein [Watersipora subatra]|uniref:uncharacterized protein n=1 Tax=Watersipora subatra TaxID=2589382 RepID=UPI00355C0D5E